MIDAINLIPIASNYGSSGPKDNFSVATKQYSSDSTARRKAYNFEQHLSPQKSDICRQILERCRALKQKQGVHSTITMNSAGFCYTNKGDEAHCDTCGLKVSGWTVDMRPFSIHAERSPTCAFVRSMQPSERIIVPSTISLTTITLASNDGEVPFKRQKTEAIQEDSHPNILVEVNMLKQIRKRTFSHWPRQASSSSAQMTEAGFFGCNVGDRVMCLYCNIICQEWTPQTANAFEVHKTLSPKCPYVVAMLKQQQTMPIPIVNEHSTLDNSVNATTNDPFRTNEIVYTAACHAAYIEIPKRHASFAAWPNDNLPPVDDLVRAGFFFTGTKTIVTCFYCNGSLQNWGATDNPTVEHARWFPHCAYAKQLCGAELYRKIQESKRAQQDRAVSNEPNRRGATTDNNVGRGQLNIPDESTLSRFVAARLDLPISQSLLDRNFKVSIIKRCYEDQLRFKHDDFIDFCDLLMACIILQKQIEYIDGKKDNIIVPSVTLSKIREKEQAENTAREQTISTSSLTNSSSGTDVEMSTSSESVTTEASTKKLATTPREKKEVIEEKKSASAKNQVDNTSSSNLCVLCLTEERRLACLPCGHMCTCVPCGHSLRSCPMCRTGIDAFMRIYV